MGKLARGKMGVLGGFSAAFATLTTGFVYLFTCLKAIGGAFGVGSITQYVGAVTALSGNLNLLLQTYGIYISHRLSSCKFCDEIAVFHEGAVIQQGTHDELVADESGKYYELWHAQAQ